MEKLAQYESIILQLLNEYAQAWQNGNTIKSQVIADIQNKHYQLVRFGWKNDEDYIHYCVFHFELTNDKIWIQENRTDILIAEELVSMGIPKQDIILGVLPPTLRKDSDYAYA